MSLQYISGITGMSSLYAMITFVEDAVVYATRDRASLAAVRIRLGLFPA